MDRKQCHQCYTELDIDTIFCPRCGIKLIMEADGYELDMADVYRAIVRLEAQLKQANINPNVLRGTQGPIMQGVAMGMPVPLKKKSSFNLTSIIIMLLIVLIMLSLSFIGTVLVNVHASGYTKTSGQVVNELLEVFKGGDTPIPESAMELPSEP